MAHLFATVAGIIDDVIVGGRAGDDGRGGGRLELRSLYKKRNSSSDGARWQHLVIVESWSHNLGQLETSRLNIDYIVAANNVLNTSTL